VDELDVGDDKHETRAWCWLPAGYAIRARRSSQGSERIIEDACAAIVCVLKQLDEHIDP
jgi:hypothetical protein